jgi:hypothetical protein
VFDNFAILNTAAWDTWGDNGDMAFTAHLSVVPEPSAAALGAMAVACCAYRRKPLSRVRPDGC